MSDANNTLPQQDDRLFISEGDYRDTAVLSPERDNLSLYAVGFKLAGDMLVERVMGDQKNHDTLVFPIAFNYRQYIELRLKQLIRDGYQFLGKPSPLNGVPLVILPYMRLMAYGKNASLFCNK